MCLEGYLLLGCADTYPSVAEFIGLVVTPEYIYSTGHAPAGECQECV